MTEEKSYMMKLNDLIPTESTFQLKQGHEKGQKIYRLRPCTSSDIINMNKIFGDVESLLGNPSAENLAKLSMHQLMVDDAKLFAPQDIEVVDAITGESTIEKLGGYKLMLRLMTVIDDQWAMYRAVLMSFGFPQDKAEELIGQMTEGLDDQVKKNIQKVMSNT